MDYKEKYEQALENLKRIKNANRDNKELVDFIEYQYPELKESEDEIIRKGLIDFLKSPFVNENITDEKVAPWIAWLEKQGKQKTGWDEEDVEMIDLLISILEINHPNKYFKSTDKGDVNIRAVPTKKIINWLKSLKERMKGE